MDRSAFLGTLAAAAVAPHVSLPSVSTSASTALKFVNYDATLTTAMLAAGKSDFWSTRPDEFWGKKHLEAVANLEAGRERVPCGAIIGMTGEITDLPDYECSETHLTFRLLHPFETVTSYVLIMPEEFGHGVTADGWTWGAYNEADSWWCPKHRSAAFEHLLGWAHTSKTAHYDDDHQCPRCSRWFSFGQYVQQELCDLCFVSTCELGNCGSIGYAVDEEYAYHVAVLRDWQTELRAWLEGKLD